MPLATLPDTDLLQRVSPAPAGVDLVVWDLADAGAAPAAHIDLVVMPYMAPAVLLRSLDGLSVGAVQGQALGFEGVADVLSPDVVFCNAAGVHETATAELALALVLAAQRDLPGFAAAQTARTWQQEFRPGLADKTVLLVGTGGVGGRLARLLQPFDVDLVRVASTAREDDLGTVHATADLPGLLGDADIVVLAVPLTPATHHLADARFLAAMRPGALLVNVARGPVVDTAALLDALRAGHIRAALDVTDPEPLPAEHPLWSAPGVLITPHVGGRTAAKPPRVEALLAEQFARLAAGRELTNQVRLR